MTKTGSGGKRSVRNPFLLPGGIRMPADGWFIILKTLNSRCRRMKVF
jgi:hypothetical protein